MKQMLRYSPLLPRLISAIGEDATVQLVSHFGGQTIRVPRHGARSPLLISAIGITAAQQLAVAFSSYDFLSIPMPDKLSEKIRNQQIVAWTLSGRTAIDIARMLNLTVRRVRQVLAEQRADQPQTQQQSLF